MVSTTRISGKTTHGSDLSEYQALVGSFPPRPIRDKKQLRQTWVRIESLLAQAQRSRAEDDYLSLLSDLVEHWEAARVKMPTLRGVELIRELLEENSLPQRALVDIRELQRKHIEGLASFFNVSPAAFFRLPESSQASVRPRGRGRARSATSKSRLTAKAR